jgi:hypothetical protein
MATAAQIAANQANALKSTGPKTPPGKAASSRNATKHGLSGPATAGLLASESGRAFLEEEKAAWRADFDPRGPEEEHLFEVVVAESIRQRRCADAYFALVRDHADRAKLQWDDDRRREADELMLGLAKRPHVVARRIEATRHGAGLKLELWRALGASLEAHQAWTDAQRGIALDLLGIHPDFRDAATPADPAGGDVLARRRALVASEVARLEALSDGALAARDELERAMAEASLGAEFSKPLQLMHRYERASWSRGQWAWRKLDEARQARAAGVESRAVAPPAAPRPAAPRPVGASSPPAPRPIPDPVLVPVSATPAPVASPARAMLSPEPKPLASRPLNRRGRRAQAAMARRAG